MHWVHNTSMTILQNWMTSKGLKDLDLVEPLGRSRSQISRLRRGVSRPEPETVEKLAEITGIPAWDFLKPDNRSAA
jgi:transcriptional regulator with XRE-family HTH domain